MINVFIWDNDFLIKEKVFSWKKLFLEKYGDMNIVHIKNPVDYEISDILWNLLTPWFMLEKKLIIIDDIPANPKNKNPLLEEEITKILDKIPETNIIIFNSSSADKRTKFYKNLLKKADKLENFSTSSEFDLIKNLEKKYSSKISRNGLNEIIKFKWKNYSKIILELEKLFITYDFVDEKIIREHIIPELEESIFTFIDNVLWNNLVLVLKNFRIIIWNTNVYQFYNWLLANLRNTVYIGKFKKLKISQVEIVNKLKLWNKAFLVWKNYALNYEKLEKLYFDLIDLDKKMKSWKLIWSSEKEFVFSMEKVFIENLK